MTKRALVVLSGGQDSTTCLYWALARGYEVSTVTFDYGQRHKREIEAALAVANIADVPPERRECVVLGPVLKGTSPLVSPAAALEQYKDMHSLPGGLENTFVPMRNQLFLTLAANRAYVRGITTVITGVCQEDFGGYPDCRRVFIDALEATCNAGTFTGEPDTLPNLQIMTPLMDMSKARTVELAVSLGDLGCFNALAYTHTSYDGQYPPIGHDHATLLRAKGFIEAGVPDPLVLRAYVEDLMPLPPTPNYSASAIRKVAHLLAFMR